jgi:hypothetical protein
MTKRLYRVPKLPPFVTFAELDKYLFAEIPVKAEADDHCRDGEWYCHNPGCSVRHVRVQIKRTAPTPAAMHCPACARPMRFRPEYHHQRGRPSNTRDGVLCRRCFA